MLIENLWEALTSILSNKMRSLLTMLGIIIGIAAVITITTIGSTLQSTINTTMNSLGGATISVYLQAEYDWESGEEYPEMTDDDRITEAQIDKLIKMYPSEIRGIVQEVVVGAGSVYQDENHYHNLAVIGEENATLEKNKLELLYGHYPTDEDTAQCKMVCVVSDRMVKYYFDEGVNPLGKLIDVELTSGEPCKLAIIGVYKYNEAQFYSSGDPREASTMCFIPITTAKKMTNAEKTGYSYVDFIMDPSVDSKVVEQHIRSYFDEVYADNEHWSVYVYNMMSELKIINVVITVITVAISVIAAISLIVGGVGVMNIMLVSITERTKEIGVRMAMGATRRTIRTQFVIEAIVLCVIGGLLGVLLGVIGGSAIGMITKIVVNNFFTDYAKLITISIRPSAAAIMISLLFSGLTGVFFGFYPANKAAKMEVIDALRYE